MTETALAPPDVSKDDDARRLGPAVVPSPEFATQATGDLVPRPRTAAEVTADTSLAVLAGIRSNKIARLQYLQRAAAQAAAQAEGQESYDGKRLVVRDFVRLSTEMRSLEGEVEDMTERILILRQTMGHDVGLGSRRVEQEPAEPEGESVFRFKLPDGVAVPAAS